MKAGDATKSNKPSPKILSGSPKGDKADKHAWYSKALLILLHIEEGFFRRTGIFPIKSSQRPYLGRNTYIIADRKGDRC